MTGYREEAPDIAVLFSELAKAAIRYGATCDEIIETIGIAVYMGGGPSFVYGAQVLEAFDQLSNEA